MSKRLQNSECHFVSIKSSNFRSSLIRIFMPLFFLLAFCCMQTELHAQQKMFNNSNYDTIRQEPVPTNPSFTVSDRLFSYPANNFRSGAEGVLKPKIFKAGGTFSYRRVSNGTGALSINTRTGVLAYFACDPGVYEVSYSIGSQRQIIIITINE